MWRRAVVAVFAITATAGCREGVPPFTPTERAVADPDAYQLTFGPGWEKDPAWTPGGDTILYQTDTLRGTLPQARGIIAAIPARGGRARVLFPEAHLGRRLLATPVPSFTGDRVAYMEVGSFDFPETCYYSTKSVCESTQARLDSAILRVRRPGDTRPFTADPSVTVAFDGRTQGTKYAHLGPYYEPLHPFQAEYLASDVMLFRPSWSPDGQHIVYSDGLALRVWNVGDATAEVIPGTIDGVSAAWSPDGESIAFALLERGDSVRYVCECGHDSIFPFINHRVLYDVAARRIVVLRPDGTERRDLGEGGEPAWSPDGRFIFATRGDQIVRIAVDDASSSVIPNTSRGRTPAVSPDGRWLAFARLKPEEKVDYDLWVVAVPE